MVIPHKSVGEVTYDISGYGLGEGLYCCTKYEIQELIKELQEVIR